MGIRHSLNSGDDANDCRGVTSKNDDERDGVSQGWCEPPKGPMHVLGEHVVMAVVHQMLVVPPAYIA